MTIIIPCHNEESILPLCLERIIEQRDSLGPNGEIIIAVNGSSDNSLVIAETCARRYSFVKTIRLPMASKKHAMNEALAMTKNSRVIFCDADTILDRDALSHALLLFERNTYAIFGAIRRPILDKRKIGTSFIETYYTMHYAKRLTQRDRLSIQGWFMAVDLRKLPDLQFPTDAAADDIWLSAFTWTHLGADAIGYIPYAIGSYLPPSTLDDMRLQLSRHRSSHKTVQKLHPQLSEYFNVRKSYYTDVDVHTSWRTQSMDFGVDFDTWISEYTRFISSIDTQATSSDQATTWLRIESSKTLSIKNFASQQ